MNYAEKVNQTSKRAMDDSLRDSKVSWEQALAYQVASGEDDIKGANAAADYKKKAGVELKQIKNGEEIAQKATS